MGRIAGILSLEVDSGSSQVDALQRTGSEIAMHIVAAKPLFLTKELVSLDAMENEREILKSQVTGDIGQINLLVAHVLCWVMFWALNIECC